MARTMTAEISPTTAAIRKAQIFNYAVKGDMDPRLDLGFDGIEIAVPDSARVNSVKVDGIQVGWKESLVLEGGELTLRVQLTDGGELGMIDESGELLEVEFESRIVGFFTRFSGRAFNSQQEVLRQTIEPGNATFSFDSDNLIVRAPTGTRLIGDMRVSPNPFTPNGDGINDAADISFTLFRLNEEVSVFSDSPTGNFRTTDIIVKMEVFDLSGRLVKTVFSKSLGSGVYDKSRDLDLSWDGRDDGDTTVSPGIYLYQITVEADAGDENVNGVVSVAY